MRIVTFRPGDSISLGGDTSLTLVGIDGNRAKVGVNAPGHVAVHRLEIYARIRDKNDAADRRD